MELYSQNEKIGEILKYQLVKGEKETLSIGEIGSSVRLPFAREITPDHIIFSMPNWKSHSPHYQIRNSQGLSRNIMVTNVSCGNNGIPVITAVLC